MKKTLSLFFILMISVLLVACEPPSVGDVAVVEPTINLSSATLNLTVGETKPLGVTVQGFAASELRYLSEDPSIASVNAAGNVTALKPGAVQVTASYQGLTQSVVVFVLPVIETVQVEVVDVQLNTDNEIILIYSDGTVENTGVQGVVEAAEPVTITSTVVNAQGNLIITLSDGTTYNAGRVVGPSGPSGPSGPAGGGGTGPQGIQGIQGEKGDPGDISSLTPEQIESLITSGIIWSALGLDVEYYPVFLNFMNLLYDAEGEGGNTLIDLFEEMSNRLTVEQLSGLIGLELSKDGFRTLLGITQEQLDQLVTLSGLISYNRYRELYPGYTLPEDVWFKELNDGTLRIDVHFNLTATLADIYFPINSEVSGVYGVDYLFVGSKFGGDEDEFLTGGTIYIGNRVIDDSLSVMDSNDMETRLLYYGSGKALSSYPNILVNSGTISTLKGALITPTSGFAKAVSVFKNRAINTYFAQIQFVGFEANDSDAAKTSGIIDASGLFVIQSGLSIRAVYEPRQQSRISAGAPNSYFTTLSTLTSFFTNLNVGQAGLTSTYPAGGAQVPPGSGLFVNGAVYDWYGNVFNAEEQYYLDYFVPMYEESNIQFNQLQRDNLTAFIGQEGYYNYPTNKNPNGNLIPANYLFEFYAQEGDDEEGDGEEVRTVSWPTYEKAFTGSDPLSSWVFTGNLAGNDLRKWDIFYTVVDSGFTVKASGILTSSGYDWASNGSNSSSTNSGFIQLTAPIRYNARNDAQGLYVRFDDDPQVSCPANACQFNHLGVTLSGVLMDAEDARFDTLDTHTIATVATVTGTLADGDIIFVRSEVNFTTGEPQEQRWMFVQDNTTPLIEPLFVGVNRAPSSAQYQLPFIAKAEDRIWISVAANEPVIFSYDEATSIFRSSGTLLTSGAKETGQLNRVFVSSQFTTLTSDHISVIVNKADVEGYFNFSGLKLIDRAGNEAVAINDTQFVNRVWIDPKAPTLETSGFTFVQDSGSVTASGVLTGSGIPFYHVSGTIQYSFDIAETLNDITSGLIKYRLELRQSGVTPFNGGSGIHDLLGTSSILEVASGLDVYTLSGLLVTNDYYNGLYLLTLFTEDLIGNKSEFRFFIFIENELFISSATLIPTSGAVGYDVTLNFNTFYVQSGIAMRD
jgi:hypothetical protein